MTKQELWAVTVIDWNVLSDDHDDALGIMPRTIYTSRKAALDAAYQEIQGCTDTEDARKKYGWMEQDFENGKECATIDDDELWATVQLFKVKVEDA